MPSIKIFKNKKFYLRFFLATLFFLWCFLGCPGFFGFPFGVQEALADTHTSVAGGGTWATGATWDLGTAPATTDDAIIATTGGSAVNIGTSTTIVNLTINSGAILTHTSTRTLGVTGNYTNNGTHTPGSGTVTFSGAGASITNNGSFGGTGAVTLSGAATQTLYGSGTFSNTGAFTLSTGAKAINSTANLTFSGPSSIAVNIATANSGTITVTNTIAIAAAVTFTNNGTVNANGAITGANATTSIWTNAANSTLNAKGAVLTTGTLTATAAGNTVNYIGAGLTCKATSYVNLGLSGSGTVTCAPTSPIAGNLTIAGTNTWAIGATLVVSGNLNVNGGTIRPGAFAFTVTGTTTIGGGTLQPSSATNTKTFTGLITVNSGTWDFQNTAVNCPATILGGIDMNGGTFTSGTGTYTLGDGTHTSQNFDGNFTISNPSVANTVTVTVQSGTFTASASLAGTGGITVASGATLSIGFATVPAISTITANSGSAITYTAAAPNCKVITYSDLNFTNSGAITCEVTVATNITTSGTTTWAYSTTLAVSGTLTVSGTSMTNTGTITVSTALAGSGEFINAAAGTLNIGFAAAPTIGTLTATASGNTVNYNRAGDQTVKAASYDNLTLSNSGIKTMTSVSIIGGNLTISDSATMTDNGALVVTGILNYSSSGSTTLKASTAVSIGKMNQTAGTIVDNANTISVTGTEAVWIETGTFTATGTISITDTSAAAKTFAGGNKTYKNLTIAGAASAGAVTITGANIFNALTLNPNSTLTLTAGTTTTISSLSATATAGNTITINSTGAYATFLNNTTNVTVSYVSIANNHATGSVTWDATDNCTNVGGNSGWHFPFSTAIEIRAQNYIASVSTITFPAGAPSAEISLPTNGVGAEVQTFGGAGSAKPVVTLVNSGTKLNIWYNISTWSPANVVASEKYIILAKGAACASANAITNTAVIGTDTKDADNTQIGSDAPGENPTQKDLYLKITLDASAGKTGTSTLSVLGETP